MCGVNVGLFFHVKMLAISGDKRPNECPVASTTYHFLSMFDGLAIKLFIVVFLLKIIRIVLHHTHAFKPKCPKQPVRTVPNAYCTLLQKSIP